MFKNVKICDFTPDFYDQTAKTDLVNVVDDSSAKVHNTKLNAENTYQT